MGYDILRIIKMSSGLLSVIRSKSQSVSLYKRIAVGNSLIIIVGAIGGTLLTRHLTDKAADLGLILLFATLGIAVSVGLNFIMLRSAMRPLYELLERVEHLRQQQFPAAPLQLDDSDPSIAQLAGTLDELIRQLNQRNSQLRALSQRAITAQEEERKRIARSLHDDTGQALTSLIIQLEHLEDQLPESQLPVKAKLAKARKLAKATLQELRQIMSGLRPAMLDDLGLAPAIRWYARSQLEEAGIRVRFDADGDLEELPTDISTALYRAAQEAINNIKRHSGAKTTQISLAKRDGCLHLSVQDDGRGFDIHETSNQALSRQQLGLLGLREQAELLDGHLSIESHPGAGTRLALELALPRVEMKEPDGQNQVTPCR